MPIYSFADLNIQLAFFDSIKEDYLYNFSFELNKPLIGPHMVQLLLTTKCNLRCKMCGVWTAKEEELGTFHIKKIIDDAYKMRNLKEVYFTGGEALLRPDIFNLIKYVKDFYPYLRTTLNTNGLLLTKKVIDRIIDVELETLSISIDSPVPAVHNALRGKGVLEKVIEGINYLNAEKKRRNVQYPLLDTCSVLMDQTLDTIYDMLEFCARHHFSGFHVQPYVCNSDLRGVRDNKFWIHQERLPFLRDVLERMASRKDKRSMLYIEVPVEKIYRYFSEPIYIDKCYAGFTRALVVGKKINFVCNGPNKEKYQHFGEGDKDSIDQVWFSGRADNFRTTIKTCKRNCVQFCSIRPSSDSVYEIHNRLVEKDGLFLVFRELHFLNEYMKKYSVLPLKGIIDSDYELIRKNLEEFVSSLDSLDLVYQSEDLKRHLLYDLKSLIIYLRNINISGQPPDSKFGGKDIENSDIQGCLSILKETLHLKSKNKLMSFLVKLMKH